MNSTSHVAQPLSLGQRKRKGRLQSYSKPETSQAKVKSNWWCSLTQNTQVFHSSYLCFINSKHTWDNDNCYNVTNSLLFHQQISRFLCAQNLHLKTKIGQFPMVAPSLLSATVTEVTAQLTSNIPVTELHCPLLFQDSTLLLIPEYTNVKKLHVHHPVWEVIHILITDPILISLSCSLHLYYKHFMSQNSNYRENKFHSFQKLSSVVSALYIFLECWKRLCRSKAWREKNIQEYQKYSRNTYSWKCSNSIKLVIVIIIFLRN